MSTQPTISDADIEQIATKVVQYMREPAARWRCQCGVCHNCLSRKGMKRYSAKKKKARAAAAAAKTL